MRFVTTDKDGRIQATANEGYHVDVDTEFEFPADFDFEHQYDYRIVDNELIYDPLQSEIDEAAGIAEGASNEVALALAQKISTATTLSQVRSFSKQVAQEYADKTITSEVE